MKRLGLDPGRTLCFGTAGSMENAVIHTTTSDEGIRVSVAITGGILGNGGRPGDPTTFDEAARYPDQKPGTIVIMVVVEASLTDGALLDAVVSATQAKSSVIRSLQARSLYSPRVATGSGTDQVGVECLKESGRMVGNAQPGTDVGKAIAKAVSWALPRALDLQTGMNPALQADPFVMLSRFGIGEADVYDEIRYPVTMATMKEVMASMHRDRLLAAEMSAILHVQDEVALGRLSEREGLLAARDMARSTMLKDGIEPLAEAMVDAADDIPRLASISLAAVMEKRAEAVEEARR